MQIADTTSARLAARLVDPATNTAVAAFSDAEKPWVDSQRVKVLEIGAESSRILTRDGREFCIGNACLS